MKPDLSNVEDALRSERGPNAQIARHRFTLSEVWQLPIGRGRRFGGDMNAALDALVGGWQLSTIWTARSGLPVNVSLAGNGVDPITGLAYSSSTAMAARLRPNQVGNPNANSDARCESIRVPQSRRLRASAAQHARKRAAQLRLGPRVLHRGPEPGETLRLRTRYVDARLEAFNALNTTNYQRPELDLGLVDVWRHQRRVRRPSRPDWPCASRSELGQVTRQTLTLAASGRCCDTSADCWTIVVAVGG